MIDRLRNEERVMSVHVLCADGTVLPSAPARVHRAEYQYSMFYGTYNSLCSLFTHAKQCKMPAQKDMCSYADTFAVHYVSRREAAQVLRGWRAYAKRNTLGDAHLERKEVNSGGTGAFCREYCK